MAHARAVPLALSLACLPGLPAAAQDYPQKPVKIIVGLAPGGGTDLMARTIGQKLGDIFGKPVLVDYRPAQGGILAAQLVAKSPADGHTLIMGTSSTFGVVPAIHPNPGFDALRDFTPVVLCSTIPNVLVVHPGVPVQTVAQLVALAREKPGVLTNSSSGVGGGGHVSGELFKYEAGVNILHVPYKGSSQAATDLLAGNVSMSFVTAVPAVPHIKAGKLRALAVTSDKRTRVLPDVPTMIEAGLPGVVVASWHGVLAPDGTPRPVVERLNAEIRRILATPEMTQLFAREGYETAAGSPDDFAAHIRHEIGKWQKMVKAGALKIEQQ